MEIDWSPISNKRWCELLNEAPRANLLQSWPYAVAARMHDQMMSRRGVIMENGELLGMLQIQEVKVGPIHVVKLDRGPLWLDADPGEQRWRSFFASFNGNFPRRIGRWRRILPELDDSQQFRQMLSEAGYRAKRAEPYRTLIVDLRPDLEQIRKRLKGKWRNTLNQAERSGVEAICDRTGKTGVAFLGAYAADKTVRGYRGAKPARLGTMMAAAEASDDLLILNGQMKGKVVAAILILRHGSGATYQAGWTGEQGRASKAHHLLLWRAIEMLKGDGVRRLDLGGIHPAMAEGVTRFKEGLGGEPVTLPGLYG